MSKEAVGDLIPRSPSELARLEQLHSGARASPPWQACTVVADGQRAALDAYLWLGRRFPHEFGEVAVATERQAELDKLIVAGK